MAAHPQAAADEHDLSGRALGGYRLLRRLGSGAMADVYLAEQSSLGRHVAVKVLRPETLRHPGAVERFVQEARAAAALVHGNIVQIHEVACVDGHHFLVAEYVAGASLRDWLVARGPLDARQALSVLEQVAAALARAAGQGIVHRDIKPENLLVTPAGEVKVADFGLARVLGEDLELTRSGMTLGTPLYMSPEQGQGRPVDVRSDLYSLGATVYHLLAGAPPYSAPTAVAVVLAHVSEPLVPLGRLRPDLPAGLSGIVDRLLAKEPAGRFTSPQELLEAVAGEKALLGPAAGAGVLPLASADGCGGASAGVGGVRTVGAAGATAVGMRGAPGRAPAATQQLVVALAREADRRGRTRRVWFATAVAALVAFGTGVAIGSRWPRRTRPFVGRRRE